MSASRPGRILHVLSQRPSRTGSGVTLEALARAAAARGWQQAAVVGTPASDPQPAVEAIAAEGVYPLVFERGAVDFPLPGMSDVMPYATSRFSALSPAQIARYQDAWREHLAHVIARVRPSIIHGHHVWLVSALIKDVAPDIPVVTHCHATGLRQMALCPHLVDECRRGVARSDAFVVLHRAQAGELLRALAPAGVDAARIHVVGAGYRDDLFHARGHARVHARGRDASAPRSLVYAGKVSRSKGLPWLLGALDELWRESGDDPVLHVIGSGAGEEADELHAELRARGDRVQLHGRVTQAELAALMRQASVFVLPSLYEGLPLVLVEAAACGLRLVATRLPGVYEELAPGLGDMATWVPLPRLRAIDVPEPDDEPAFVAALAAALRDALARGPLADDPAALAARLSRFRWPAVFERVESVYRRFGVESAASSE